MMNRKAIAHFRDTHYGSCDLPLTCFHTVMKFFKSGQRVVQDGQEQEAPQEGVQCTAAEQEACVDGATWAFCWCAKYGARGEAGEGEEKAEKGYKLWREITAFISKWQLFIFLPQAYLLTSHPVRICWSRRGRPMFIRRIRPWSCLCWNSGGSPVSNQPPNGQEAPLRMGVWQGLSELSGSGRGFFVLLLLPKEGSHSMGYASSSRTRAKTVMQSCSDISEAGA